MARFNGEPLVEHVLKMKTANLASDLGALNNNRFRFDIAYRDVALLCKPDESFNSDFEEIIQPCWRIFEHNKFRVWLKHMPLFVKQAGRMIMLSEDLYRNHSWQIMVHAWKIRASLKLEFPEVTKKIIKNQLISLAKKRAFLQIFVHRDMKPCFDIRKRVFHCTEFARLVLERMAYVSRTSHTPTG